MTNGEKLKEIFPNMRITLCESYVQVMGENYEFNNTYPLKWWNAEYQEPTTDSNIPFLMHKEMDIPISECQKAYDIALEYLRSQAKVKG